MLLANESLLMTVAFVGLAGVIVVIIGDDYGDTIQAINSMSDSRSAGIAESVGVLDVQKGGNTAYIILSNHSEDAVALIGFWDEDGDELVCSDSGGVLEGLQIPAGGTVTISCAISGTHVIVSTANYNLIRIKI